MQLRVHDLHQRLKADTGTNRAWLTEQLQAAHEALADLAVNSLKPSIEELLVGGLKGGLSEAGDQIEGIKQHTDKMIEELLLEGKDTGKELAALYRRWTGKRIGRVELESELSKLMKDPNFNVQDYFFEQLKALVTLGTSVQAQAVADYYDGKIDSKEMFQRIGAAGVLQLMAGLGGRSRAPQESIADEEGGQSRQESGKTEETGNREEGSKTNDTQAKSKPAADPKSRPRLSNEQKAELGKRLKRKEITLEELKDKLHPDDFEKLKSNAAKKVLRDKYGQHDKDKVVENATKSEDNAKAAVRDLENDPQNADKVDKAAQKQDQETQLKRAKQQRLDEERRREQAEQEDEHE